jgi:hypothetical protein
MKLQSHRDDTLPIFFAIVRKKLLSSHSPFDLVDIHGAFRFHRKPDTVVQANAVIAKKNSLRKGMPAFYFVGCVCTLLFFDGVFFLARVGQNGSQASSRR